jgi:hypothetical protein
LGVVFGCPKKIKEGKEAKYKQSFGDEGEIEVRTIPRGF